MEVSTENIAKLKEQTAFLLEKQEELFQFCNEKFENLISYLEEKIAEKEDSGEGDLLDKYQKIDLVLQKQSKNVLEEIETDVLFLKEQLEAITEVQSNDDPVKRDELAAAIMESEELLETEEFKEDVLQEVEDSKKGFEAVAADIMAALEEENLDEVLVYLQEMESSQEASHEDLDEEGCQEEDCGSCEKKSCKSSCCKCCDDDNF